MAPPFGRIVRLRQRTAPPEGSSVYPHSAAGTRYQFAIRASAETWRKFGQEAPPAMYHGLFAASFREDMSLEGDLLVLMQNLRCVVRQIELLRTTGVPV